jgi:GH35 family endo-1,4-beta-xylanase
MSSKKILKESSIAGISPEIITTTRTKKISEKGALIFKPYFIQRGIGPNLLDWAYTSDENWDAFYSNISASNEGVKISDTEGKEKFGIDVRWNVEGFGYIFITADNGGEFYELPKSEKSRTLNLNYELAKSRIVRNRKRLNSYQILGWIPSYEIKAIVDLSEELYEDATKNIQNGEKCGELSQKSLLYAMKAGEMIELEKAKHDIISNGVRKDFYIGCDARGFYQMDPDLFMQLFTDLFNYATITYYLISGTYQDFEPLEGKKDFATRDVVFDKLRNNDIIVEGRPLYWPYRTVTPDWLRNKSYDQILQYVEKHVKQVVGHYGDGMYAWEIVNESHDWANETQLTPDQITNVTKLACDVAKDTNPKVGRLINNCCPFAEYVQLKKWGELDAKYPQRTPHQFLQDLVDNDVDFTITGQQMYFPYRDLADTIILLERLEKFARPVQLTEVGTSSGPSKASIDNGSLEISQEPYIWHRHWDQNLQAEWLEGLYTLAYSKKWIEAVNWYDFVDPYSWIKNGGLIESPKGEKKVAYERLMKLQKVWGLS